MDSLRSATAGVIERVSRWLLLCVIVVSVLALGSVAPDALLVTTALATVSAAGCLIGRGFGKNALPAPAWLILSLTAYTILQATPLPATLVRLLAPANREIWDGAFEVLGEHSPTWLTLSLDPGASWLEACKGWLYACVFVVSATLGARRGAGFGATVLLGSALIFALVCLGHGLTEATRVFGVYLPTTHGAGFAVAPLLNPNNRASYLNLGILCGVSLLAMPHPPISRWLVGLAIPPIVGVTLLTGSRGGLLGLGVGLGCLLLLIWPKLGGKRGDSLPHWQVLLLGGLLLAAGGIFAAAAAGPKLRHLLLEQDGSKLGVMVTALRLIPEHFWTGIGRGSFEGVFPALRTGSDNTISSHPENFVVQWVTEWGLPVALAGLGSCLWLFRPRSWGFRTSIPACGLFAAAVSLVAQNLVDLGSEVPGIMVAGTAAAGFAWGARTGKTRSIRDAKFLTPATLLLGGLLLWAGARYGRTNIPNDRQWLRDQRASGEGWPALRADVRAAMLRHPAEPYFPRLAAVAAWQSRAESPLPWIGRALSRGMSAGRTHYLLGGYLASTGHRSQALMELRLAAGYDPNLVGRAVRLAVQLTRQEGELARVVPDGAAGVATLTALAKNLATADRSLATSFLRQAVARDPGAAEARVVLARRLLEDVEQQDTNCADPGPCIKEVAGLLTGLGATNSEMIQLRARLLMAQGNSSEAVKLLANGCRRSDRPLPCIASWVDAAKRAQDRDALHQAARALDVEDCSIPARCNGILWSAGQAALALGDNEFALRSLERAASQQGTSGRWREVARIAREAGQPARATSALAHARALSPSDPTLTRDLDSMRHDTIEQLLRK